MALNNVRLNLNTVNMNDRQLLVSFHQMLNSSFTELCVKWILARMCFEYSAHLLLFWDLEMLFNFLF